MNNFQRLMEEEEKNSPQPPPFVQNNVENSLGMFRFIGQIVEVYLPQLSGMLVNLVGGSESETYEPTNTERRNTPHSEGAQPHRGPNTNIGDKGRG